MTDKFTFFSLFRKTWLNFLFKEQKSSWLTHHLFIVSLEWVLDSICVTFTCIYNIFTSTLRHEFFYIKQIWIFWVNQIKKMFSMIFSWHHGVSWQWSLSDAEISCPLQGGVSQPTVHYCSIAPWHITLHYLHIHLLATCVQAPRWEELRHTGPFEDAQLDECIADDLKLALV